MNLKNKKLMIGIGVALVIIIVIVMFASKGGKKADSSQRTVTVTRDNIIDKALAVGSLEPLHEIAVKSKISGVVNRLFVDVGNFVKKDEPLLEIKPNPTPMELAEAKRNLESAEIELKTLEKDLKRTVELKEKGLISDQDFDILQQQYDQANVGYQIARERLELIQSGKVQIAGTHIETVIYSPMTGYILEKAVDVGDPVVPLTSYQAGTELMKLADMESLLFKGTVDEIDVGKIHEGMAADIKVGALPGVTVKGHVTLISLKARNQDNTTVFPVEIQIDVTGDSKLRAGFSANADIIINRKDSVLTIPERVITFRNDSAFVMIPSGENDSEERYIKTGLSNAIQIEVLEGLEQGQTVLEKKQVTID